MKLTNENKKKGITNPHHFLQLSRNKTPDSSGSTNVSSKSTASNKVAAAPTTTTPTQPISQAPLAPSHETATIFGDAELW